jgi:hypothetical protein
MDEKSIAIAVGVICVVATILWKASPNWRWQVKAGLWALGILAVAVIAVYPGILTVIGL